MPKSIIEINASPREVFKVITDYEAYPEFLDEIGSVQVLQTTSRFVVVGFRVRLGRAYSYRLKYTETPFQRGNWTYVSGDFRDYSGTWTLHPEGNRTRAELDLEIKLGSLAKKAVGKVAASMRVASITRRFKERIEAGLHLREASLDRMLEDYEHRILSRYLRRHDWNLSEAAAMLSISEDDLTARIRRHGLKPDKE